MSGTPEWLDDKGKIIEHKYCQCFLAQHPLLSKGEDFFTTEGIVTDKDRLLRESSTSPYTGSRLMSPKSPHPVPLRCNWPKPMIFCPVS